MAEGNGTEHLNAVGEPIAILGIGCRYPGGIDDPVSFWNLLCSGGDGLVEVPPYRWSLADVYDPRPEVPGRIRGRKGGFLGPVDSFDAAFFGISPREAPRVDPQQRLLLETAWEALEDAGLPLDGIPRERAGVFLGMMTNEFEQILNRDPEALDMYGLNGSGRYGACGRLSFCLGFEGPSLCVDTACSSSLVSVHLACQSLRSGECEVALAGGSHLILQPHVSIAVASGGILSEHCRFGDAGANGFVRSEGVGLIVLKRLSRALADGDRIYAVILGSAVNSDGHSGDTMATPSSLGQKAMLREAYRLAGVPPDRVRYVEAHGTGTSVGDRIELEALSAVLGLGRPEDRRCMVGSVKTNLGHTEGASGVAGLIKLALCLSHRAIPPSLHCEELNPNIPWDRMPLILQRQGLVSWPDDPFLAVGGVNSFGLSGTNAHIVLQEPPREGAATGAEPEAGPWLVTLSARGGTALRERARTWREMLSAPEAPSLGDLAWTAGARRHHLEHRLAVVAASRMELARALESFVHGGAAADASGAAAGAVAPDTRHRVAFVFPGQGSQWLGMGRELLAREPVFREALERCDRVLRFENGWSLLDQLTAGEGETRLDEIDVVQPLLFSIQVALAALWRSWGIIPAVVVGHSMGEVAAAHVAGALSLADAARVICRRSRLLRRVSGRGAMLVVELPLAAAAEAVAGSEDHVSIAVSNSPESTVLSGDPEVLRSIAARLEAQDTFCRWVKVDVASHSPQMDPLRDDLLAALDGLEPRTPEIPFRSTVGGEDGRETTFDPAYWVCNLRQPVMFSAVVWRLLEDGFDTFLEMSPHPLLLPSVEQTARHVGLPVAVLPSLRREEPERGVMLCSLARLYAAGHAVDWAGVFPRRGRLVHLPAYPWQRERFWIREVPAQGLGAWRGGGRHPLLGPHVRLAAPAGVHAWEMDLREDDPAYLTDHRVQGAAVLPAAAYLEMALAASEESLGAARSTLSEMCFEAALRLPRGHGIPVQVVLTEEPGGASIQVFSRDGDGWMRHAAGRLRDEATAAPAVDLDGLRGRCGEELSGAEHYRSLAERGLEYGPAFQGVERVWRGEGEAVARVVRPGGGARGARGHRLHPAWLDACLQVLLHSLPAALRLASADTWLPVEVRGLRLWRAPEEEEACWVHARLRGSAADIGETAEGDLAIVDERGEVLVRVEGLVLRRLARDLEHLLGGWFYEVHWEPAPLPAGSRPGVDFPATWLLLAPPGGLAEAFAEQLVEQGQRCVRAEPGDVRTEGFLRAVRGAGQEQAPLREVVYLGSPGAADEPEAAARACEDVLALAQALAREGTEAPVRLWLVTDRAQAALPGEPESLSQAALTGLGRVIAAEHPELRCTRIDADFREGAESLVRELWLGGSETEVALRGGGRLIPHLVRSTPPPLADAPELRRDGTYLITGGLGGLGLEIARWMAERGAGHLVLLGRSGGSERARRAIPEIEALGARVVVARADVAVCEELAGALGALPADLPPLRGVLHAAGVLDDAPLTDLDAARLRKVLAPKVQGAWNLHRLTREAPLDLFVLFSSAATILGNRGQSVYAAANSFLEGLAAWRQGRGLPGLAVAWGAWAEVGLAAQGDRQRHLARRGIGALRPRQGCEALGRVLGHAAPLVAVMAMDWSLWFRVEPDSRRAPLLSRLAADEATEEPDAGVPLADLLGAAGPEERRSLIESRVRREVAAVLRLPPVRLDESRTLTQLGLDSLMALELKARLSGSLGTSVSVARLLQGWGFRQLVGAVLDQTGLNAEAAAGPEMPEGGAWEELEL